MFLIKMPLDFKVTQCFMFAFIIIKSFHHFHEFHLFGPPYINNATYQTH